MTENNYDLVIIGGGSAGLTAAEFALQLGVRVTIVEANRIGGDCTWTGCVPSKALLKTATVAHQMRNADRFGLNPSEPKVDLGAVMDRVKDVIHDVYEEEKPEALRADGIDVFIGPARFLDPHTLMAGETRLSGRHFLIATGAHPYTPPIPGLGDVDYLIYETVWDLRELPEHLLIVGAGHIGCEMAQAFRRLGSQVTLVDMADRLLPRNEAEASNAITQVFEAEGINLLLGVEVSRVWKDGEGIHILAGGIERAGDALLMVTGRRPNVADIGLELAGVSYSSDGIDVDRKLRTSRAHIYAAGDCTGGDQYTHYAGWQAVMAVRNAFLPGSSKGTSEQVPWTIFTDPEVAHAGLGEIEARERYGNDVMVCEWDMERVDRARTDGATNGFIKLVHKKDGDLLGVTIVATRAGEMLHEWILALHKGIKVGDLASAIHVYPTYSMASMRASAAIRIGGMLDGASGKIIRGLARMRI